MNKKTRLSPLPGGFFYVHFFWGDGDNGPLRFTVMKSYTYVIVVNKHPAILWTTDKISTNSTVWSAHNYGVGACIGRGFEG
jgi:hypothetical protein